MGRLGVCSWSLQAADAAGLAHGVRQAGVGGVQLALDPIRTGALDQAAVAESFAGIGAVILSGMMAMRGEDYGSLETIRRTGGVGPDATWADNLDAAEVNARIAADLGVPLVTFHAGHLPAADEDRRTLMLDRVRRIAAPFRGRGIRVGLETGQEDPDTLLGLLLDLADPGIGVNFDPANMILYGSGDPVEALDLLADHVLQLHIKDALPADVPGTWGTEVPAGTGAVDWGALFDVVRSRGITRDLVIERESGTDRLADIRTAAALVRAFRSGL